MRRGALEKEVQAAVDKRDVEWCASFARAVQSDGGQSAPITPGALKLCLARYVAKAVAKAAPKDGREDGDGAEPKEWGKDAPHQNPWVLAFHSLFGSRSDLDVPWSPGAVNECVAGWLRVEARLQRSRAGRRALQRLARKIYAGGK